MPEILILAEISGIRKQVDEDQIKGQGMGKREREGERGREREREGERGR